MNQLTALYESTDGLHVALGRTIRDLAAEAAPSLLGANLGGLSVSADPDKIYKLFSKALLKFKKNFII
jgi:hypothetical protein